jgi:chitinase
VPPSHDGGAQTQDSGSHVSPDSGGAADGGGAADSGGGGTDSGGQHMVGNFPARFAAPYVETWNDNNLANLANTTGHKFYTLAFVINGTGTCNPTWNGDTALTGNGYGGYIQALRALGGDVIVSFGGADGTELGRSCTTVASLQAAYQKVIDAFHLTWLDLDIESGAESDTPSVDRRNQALHALQMANPGLRVSYTLGVDRTGLPSAQLGVVKSAIANGAHVDVVNIMAMDYGPCYSDMGQAAIDAANATKTQLAGIGSPAAVGITPMIGVNDVSCENFTTSDSQQVVTFANANPFVHLLAFWALGADNGHANLSAFHAFH